MKRKEQCESSQAQRKAKLPQTQRVGVEGADEQASVSLFQAGTAVAVPERERVQMVDGMKDLVQTLSKKLTTTNMVGIEQILAEQKTQFSMVDFETAVLQSDAAVACVTEDVNFCSVKFRYYLWRLDALGQKDWIKRLWGELGLQPTGESETIGVAARLKQFCEAAAVKVLIDMDKLNANIEFMLEIFIYMSNTSLIGDRQEILSSLPAIETSDAGKIQRFFVRALAHLRRCNEGAWVDAFLQRDRKAKSEEATIVTTTDAEFVAYQYQRPENIEHFASYLDYYMNSYVGEKLNSPLTTVCQSSGYGKSKMLVEMGKQGIFHVLYVCLRASSSSGIPSRTPGVVNTLTSKVHRNKETWQSFLTCCVDVALHRGYSAQTLACLLQSKDLYTFWNDVMAAFNTMVSHGKSVAADDFRAKCQMLCRQGGASKGVVFVFDEARELLAESVQEGNEIINNFRWLREALQNLAGERGRVPFFGVLVDTTSRISNFLPTNQNDPSFRKNPSLNLNVCPPCYVLETLGQVEPANRGVQDAAVLQHNDVCFESSYSQLISLGRPMFVVYWDSYFSSNRDAANALLAWSATREFARNKLLMSGVDRRRLNELQRAALVRETHIAAISCRINYIPARTNREELVASHVATLLGVSRDRSDLLIEYVAEPILAEAACLFWHVESDRDLMIETFSQCIEDGMLVELYREGEIGEVIAMVILCRVYDGCIEDVYLTPGCSSSSSSSCAVSADSSALGLLIAPVPVRLYIERLLRTSTSFGGFPVTWELVQSHVALSSGVLCVSQFIHVSGVVTKEMLREAARRRVAIKCRKGEMAVDAVIPVVVPNRNASHVNMHTLEGCRVGALLVQVKNHEHAELGPSKMQSLVEAMTRYAEITFTRDFLNEELVMGLVMAVGSIRVFKNTGKLRSMLISGHDAPQVYAAEEAGSATAHTRESPDSSKVVEISQNNPMLTGESKRIGETGSGAAKVKGSAGSKKSLDVRNPTEGSKRSGKVSSTAADAEHRTESVGQAVTHEPRLPLRPMPVFAVDGLYESSAGSVFSPASLGQLSKTAALFPTQVSDDYFDKANVTVGQKSEIDAIRWPVHCTARSESEPSSER